MQRLEISDNINVLAISYKDNITENDIDHSYELINLALANNKPLTLYIELLDDFSVEIAALLKDLKKSPEMLKKLKYFDRIAVVTDRDWMRNILHVEEALLSLFLSDLELNVYTVSERAQAISWINDETPYSHAPAIKDIATHDPNIAAFEIDGKIRSEDIKHSKEIMAQFMTDDPPRLLLAKIINLHGLKLSSLFDKQMFQMKKEARKHIDRYAIVGGPEWLQHLARAMNPLFTCQIRTFELENEDDAWKWLKEKI